MLIHVTQSHIDRGYRGDGQNCPVALAIEEATGYTVLVESDWITVVDHNLLRWRILGTIEKFIYDFDNMKPVEPFEFELDVEGVEVDG